MARVLELISTPERRGAETFAVALADHLGSVGHSVTVMALAPPPGAGGFDVPVAGRHRWDPAGWFRLVRAARKADIVIGFGSITLITGAITATAARRPFVYRSIGDPRVWGRVTGAGVRIGIPLRRARRVVALFEDAASYLRSAYGLGPARVSVIPRGVDTDRFPRTDAGGRDRSRAALGLDPAMTWVAWVGAMTPEKRPDLAVDVLDHLPPGFGLLMAGGGPLLEGLASTGRRHRRRLRLLGPVHPVTDVLHAADAILLTSATEGIPGVLIEAGLCGLPAVATRVGGVADVVVDGVTGILVEDPSPEKLAVAIADATRRGRALGDAARERCLERFSLAGVGSRWDLLVREVTGPGHGTDHPPGERSATRR